MARQVKRKARKDYPENGIKRGDDYYFCAMKTGPRSSRIMRSLTPFKRSQMTQSEFLGALYDWEDSLAALESMEDAQNMADEIRQLGEEQDEKFNNMPEGLQQGDSGQLLEQRRDACEAAAEAIEEVISEWESAKSDHETDDEGDKDEDAETDDEFLDRVKEVSVDV